MTDLRTAAQQALGAKQTPLIELLERIPQDARLVVEHDQFSSSVHPVGRLCHEAAAALRAALTEPCPCGDRPAAQCPGEWEPGCDLGNNPKYAKRVEMTPKELAASIKRGEKWKVAEPVQEPVAWMHVPYPGNGMSPLVSRSEQREPSMYAASVPLYLKEQL